MTIRRAWKPALVTVLVLPLVPATARAGGSSTFRVFHSPSAVVIVDGTTATPYPSTIDVAGMTGTLTAVTIGWLNFEHVAPRDTDALLVSPSGASVVLFSDACGLPDMINVQLVFDDAAPGPLPMDPPTACVSGAYQPSDWDLGPGDVFPPPAPPAPWGTTLAGLLGGSPNGAWSLYLVDDLAVGDPPGRIDEWTLTLVTDPDVLFFDGFETADTSRWSAALL